MGQAERVRPRDERVDHRCRAVRRDPRSARSASGFGCAEQDGGTICRIEQKRIDLDDNEVTLGETHYVRGNGWVSTAWINFAPEGYTEDIADTLWG